MCSDVDCCGACARGGCGGSACYVDGQRQSGCHLFEACVGHVLIWLALVAAELAAVGLAQPPCAAMPAAGLRSARAVQNRDDRWRLAASRLLWYRQSKLALC